MFRELIIYFILVCMVSVVYADYVVLTATNVVKDGYVLDSGSSSDFTSNFMYSGCGMILGGSTARAGIYFNISSISDVATITDVTLNFSVSGAALSSSSQSYIYDMGGASGQADAAWYADAGDGTAYINAGSFAESTGWKPLDLGATADAHLQANLSTDEFGVGILVDVCDSDGVATIDTVESANDPELHVTYTTGGGDTCTCAGVDTNWEIDLSDECLLSTPCNLGTGNLSFINTGNFYCDSDLNVTIMTAPNVGMWINDSCNILMS